MHWAFVLWCIAQIGIVLEIYGAFSIYSEVRKTSAYAAKLETHLDSSIEDELKQIVADQAVSERRGFLWLGIGLAFQFAGGLGFFSE